MLKKLLEGRLRKSHSRPKRYIGLVALKVMIGRVSNSKDIEYHKAILAKGVYIAFDRLGLDFIPALKAAGVTDAQIKTMMVDNPKNLFLGI